MSLIKLTIGNLLIRVILIIPHTITHLKYPNYGGVVDEIWDSTGNALANLSDGNDAWIEGSVETMLI